MMMPGDMVLELTEATVVKNGVRVLDGLTLAIRAGEHTAIVGPNGAGKSTLINVLTQQDHALARDEGATPPVRIFGDTFWNVFDLRSRLGIVSADLHHRFVNGNAAGSITGERAVLSGFSATLGFVKGPITSAMRDTARQALEQMDAVHLAAKTLDEMSSGEARRVLIARALVTSPDALVLDEPTAGLDVVARHRFLERVRRIARDGTTLVLVTHHVEEIVPEIERVVLLKHGRVALAGVKPATLTSAHLSLVYGAPIALHESGGYYHARV
jgi:iron complex transport system ATP-binding protein